MSRKRKAISFYNFLCALFYAKVRLIISKKTIKVVIMDLTVPGGMGGKDTIKVLLEIDPKVHAIVSSGYSNDPVMSNYIDYGFKAVVKKPFRIETLNDTLSKIFNEN